MQTMESMGVKKYVKKPGTSYISDNNNLIAAKTHIPEGFIKRPRNSFMGTARTKDRRPAGIQ
jgi:hypothetical protein